MREREREMQQQQQQQQRRAQKRSNYDAGNPREEWGEAKRQAMQYDATTSRYKGGLAANRYSQADIILLPLTKRSCSYLTSEFAFASNVNK